MKNIALMVWMICGVATPFGQAQQVIQLYEGLPKGSESWTWDEQLSIQNVANLRLVYNVSRPTLTAYLPPAGTENGTALIVAPGGAFHLLAIDIEGIDVAKWLNKKGVAVFVLRYRLGHSKTTDPSAELGQKIQSGISMDEAVAPIVPLAVADGLQAVKYVREHAEAFGVNPNRIGLMGFSAGGTVTVSAAYQATDENRPNFIAPIYPYTKAALGTTVPTTPTPMFVAVASDDKMFVTQSMDLYQKWVSSNQAAELHVYESGGHGFGMKRQSLASDAWPKDFENWLTMHHLLIRQEQAEQWKRTGIRLADVARWQEENEERLRSDWGYLKRYQTENQNLPAPKQGQPRVVFMGDSITEGWVAAAPAFFAENGYLGRGISGQTTPQALVRFRQDVLDLKPAATVILLGTNDIAQNTGYISPQQTLANIASMAELAATNGIKVILCAILPAYDFPWRPGMKPADKVLELNEMIKAYAKQKGFIYVDYHTAMKDNRNGLPLVFAEDGIHPNLKGYKVMEALVKPAITAALAKRKGK